MSSQKLTTIIIVIVRVLDITLLSTQYPNNMTDCKEEFLESLMKNQKIRKYSFVY